MLEKEQELQKSLQQEVTESFVYFPDGIRQCLCTQLSSKDIRLEQLQKELEVLMAAKQELDKQVNPAHFLVMSASTTCVGQNLQYVQVYLLIFGYLFAMFLLPSFFTYWC